MLGSLFRHARPRRAALVVAAVAALGAAGWFLADHFTHRAAARAAQPDQPPGAAPHAGDYASRVVAYIHTNQPVTRQDLGEYLLARYGADKLPLLVNRRIIDRACANRGVAVTAAEVEASLSEDLKAKKIDLDTFVKSFLPRYKKNLLEWKEDVLRPKLQMARLVTGQITVSDDEMRKAFESAYGEKIACRMIVWPLNQEKLAMEQYAALRDSEEAFAEAAKRQPASELAAAGGKVKPIARYATNPHLEQQAFALRPGQVSTLIKTTDGIVLLKCDGRVPADNSVSFGSVKDYLAREIRERKLAIEIAAFFKSLKEQARPSVLLKKRDRQGPAAGHPSPGDAVAYIHGNVAITREELGEFLIARYGAEKIEFLVNRRIIDAECAARGVAVSAEEVEAQVEKDLKVYNVDARHFEKELLGKINKNMYEYREDIVRPQLLLRKLCQGRAKVTEEDVKKGFEARYGEQLECRIILWPHDQVKYAMAEYARLRDSEEEFARKAKAQPSPTLAAHGGKIPRFGRHSLGDDSLEREAFRLRKGEVSTLIGTAQGQVVIKCDERYPPDARVKLDQVREAISADVLERKVQLEMQVAFKELKDKAKPQLILRPAGMVEDLAASARELMTGLPPAPPGP